MGPSVPQTPVARLQRQAFDPRPGRPAADRLRPRPRGWRTLKGVIPRGIQVAEGIDDFDEILNVAHEHVSTGVFNCQNSFRSRRC